MLELDISGQSHCGLNKLRPTNQDGLFYRNNIFAVIDGMGGYGGGDKARDIALAVIEEQSKKPPADDNEALLWMEQTFTLANDRICHTQASTSDPALRKMGATAILAFAVTAIRKLFIGHLGNARAYRLREGKLLRLTRDHLVLLEAGLTEEEAAKHRLRSVVSRCLGRQPMADIALNQSDIQPGDLFLLCSDGLSNYVRDPNIQAVLVRDKHASQLVNDLINTALSKNAQDNVTALVVRALKISPMENVSFQSRVSENRTHAYV